MRWFGIGQCCAFADRRHIQRQVTGQPPSLEEKANPWWWAIESIPLLTRQAWVETLLFSVPARPGTHDAKAHPDDTLGRIRFLPVTNGGGGGSAGALGEP
jgi:hypothetical protein